MADWWLSFKIVYLCVKFVVLSVVVGLLFLKSKLIQIKGIKWRRPCIAPLKI